MLIIKASTVIENPLLPHSPQGPQRERRGRDELIRVQHSQSLPQALDIDPTQNHACPLWELKKISSHLSWQERAWAGGAARPGIANLESEDREHAWVLHSHFPWSRPTSFSDI